MLPRPTAESVDLLLTRMPPNLHFAVAFRFNPGLDLRGGGRRARGTGVRPVRQWGRRPVPGTHGSRREGFGQEPGGLRVCTSGPVPGQGRARRRERADLGRPGVAPRCVGAARSEGSVLAAHGSAVVRPRHADGRAGCARGSSCAGRRPLCHGVGAWHDPDRAAGPQPVGRGCPPGRPEGARPLRPGRVPAPHARAGLRQAAGEPGRGRPSSAAGAARHGPRCRPAGRRRGHASARRQA